MTLNGDDTTSGVVGGTGAKCKALQVFGVANINGGHYSVGEDENHEGNGTIEVWGSGIVNIYGGMFESEKAYKDKYYVLNRHNPAVNSQINVYGGIFMGQDPRLGDDVIPGSYVAQDKTVVEFTVEENVVYVVLGEENIANVATEDEITAAAANEDIMLINLTADIQLTKLLKLSRMLMINGQKDETTNYKLVSEREENYAIYVTPNAQVIVTNVDIIGSETVANGAKYASFGIGFGANSLTQLINVNMSGYRYALAPIANKVQLMVIDSTITAWSALNCIQISSNSMIMFEDSTLTGINSFDNPFDNNFATIVFSEGTTGNLVSLSNCVINTVGNGTAYQAAVVFQADAAENHVSCDEHCTFNYTGNTQDFVNNGVYSPFTGDLSDSESIPAWIAANNIVWVENESDDIINQMRLNVYATRDSKTYTGKFDLILDGTDGSWYAQDGDELHLLTSVELDRDVIPYATTGTIRIVLGTNDLYGAYSLNTITGTGKIILNSNLTFVVDRQVECFTAPAGYVVVETDNGNGTYSYTAVVGAYVSTAADFTAAAATNNTTIILADDFTSTSDIVINKNVTLLLNNHTITFTGWGFEVREGAILTLNGNGGIEAEEACLLAKHEGNIIVNGGTYTSTANFVIGTDGTNGDGNNTIIINGGTFNADMVAGGRTAGYIACGVYVANSDVVTINAGTFNVTNGAGLVARSGSTTVKADAVFNVTGDETTGMVGQSTVSIPTGEELVLDLLANYPGGVPTITNNTAYNVYTVED